MSEQPQQRLHHPYSPSSLQSREACPCFDPDRESTPSALEKALRGTMQHDAVEKNVIPEDLDDHEAEAVELCLGIVEETKALAGEGCIVRLEPLLRVDDREVKGRGSDGKLRVFKGTTAGYADVVIVSADRKRGWVLDWKFGAWDVEPTPTNRQGHSYLLGLFREFPTLEEITVAFISPHRDEGDSHTFRREDFAALYVGVSAVVERSRAAHKKLTFKEANPTTSGCLFCAHKGRCPALAEHAIQLGKKYVPLEAPSNLSVTARLTQEEAGEALRYIQTVKEFCESFRRAQTERAVDEDDWIPAGYKLTVSQDRKVADKSEIIAVASEYLSPEEIEEARSVTFGPLEKAIKAKAPRGSKQDAVDAFNEQLESRGAVTKSDPRYVLRLNSEPKEQE